MKKFPKEIRLRLDTNTRAAITRLAFFEPEAELDEVVEFLVDLALVNIHLLGRHISGAMKYAEENNISLREVFAGQLALQLIAPKKSGAIQKTSRKDRPQ